MKNFMLASSFHIELLWFSFEIKSPSLKSSVTLARIGRVGRDGFGLFGLREGRLFVPHGQKLAKEVGASSTFHAFSEGGYNYHRTL